MNSLFATCPEPARRGLPGPQRCRCDLAGARASVPTMPDRLDRRTLRHLKEVVGPSGLLIRREHVLVSVTERPSSRVHLERAHAGASGPGQAPKGLGDEEKVPCRLP